MLHTFIDQHAEEVLYAFLIREGSRTSASQDIHFLKCDFFQINKKLSQKDLEACFGFALEGQQLRIYMCDDGDVIIQSENDSKEVFDLIKDLILKKHRSDIEFVFSSDSFFSQYSLANEFGKLKAICAKKQKRVTRSVQNLKSYLSNGQLIQTFKNTISLISMQRQFRSKPHILIVEDQAFSHKILTKVLSDYTCLVCENASEAIVTYIEKCPDIVLLDIELPDFSGHDYAKFINKIDPKAHIIMVSANWYEDDIAKAKANKVKGFIAKPFKKDNVLNAIEKYKR